MNPQALFKSIYLGDRACKSFVYDETKRKLGIQVDCISFLRPGTEIWDFYTDKDIHNGWIVLEGVTQLSITSADATPNDFINDISVEKDKDSSEYFRVIISIDSVSSNGDTTEVTISVLINNAHVNKENGNRLDFQ